jgi:hypothetical protein
MLNLSRATYPIIKLAGCTDGWRRWLGGRGGRVMGRDPEVDKTQEGRKDVRVLSTHGADVAAHGRRYGTTPLALAVLTVQHDVIRILLAKGVDVWALHKFKGGGGATV